MYRIFGMFFSIIAVAGCILLAPVPSHAEEDGTEAKEAIAAALSEKKSAQAALAQKTRALEKEMEALRQRLVAMSKDIRATEEELGATTRKLKDLKREQAELAAQLYREHDRMGGLVTAVQRFNRTSTPTMLVESDPLEAARAALVIRSAIPALHRKSAALRARLAALHALEEDIAAEKSAQARSLSRINVQEAALSRALEKRQAIYAQTEAERRAREKEVARLAREAKSLEDLVEKINLPVAKPRAAGERTASGRPAAAPAGLYAPVAGAVRTAFGATDDLGATSKGITYNARGGARVTTPLAGTVRFAGPFRKYKHILIIEHPEGYHSLIAGLGRVDTVVGAALSPGEPVGTVAETDADHHPVYYELRHNGAPINPQKILIAQRKQDKS